MAYIIDTDWIIEMIWGNRQTIQMVDRLRSASISVSLLTLGEVYEGAFNSSNSQEMLKRFQQFSEDFTPIGLDGGVAERFAEIRAYLRRTGNPIDDVDAVVAAIALERDLTVLTYNRRHFERIPDLRVYRAEG